MPPLLISVVAEVKVLRTPRRQSRVLLGTWEDESEGRPAVSEDVGLRKTRAGGGHGVE